MKYIDSEIILNRKIGPLVYVYIMIIIVIMLFLIILFILCYYKTYYTARGVVVNDNDNEYFYIRMYIPLDNMKYITDNNIVKIDGLEYSYNIVSIDSEYFTDNLITYQIIMIEVNLKDKYRFNNLTLDLKFLKENKRIIDYILK